MADDEDLKEQVPSQDELYNPTLKALRDLGGSGSNSEIAEQVISTLDLSEEVAEVSHLGSTTQTELEYRLAWARTSLRKAGFISNSGRGVWALTAEGRETDKVDPDEVRRRVREDDEEDTDQDGSDAVADSEAGDGVSNPKQSFEWRERLLTILKELEPDAFERLCQRVLRESGFVQVQVTERSGDGGIDGHGMVKMAGLLNFPVVFQCKRYEGSVGPDVIRELRGSMDGRADRGLVITTGRFTKGAREEATRDGATPVDLIDGDDFVEKLRDLELGVDTETVEVHRIDEDWFEEI